MFERAIASVNGGAGDADAVALGELLVAPEGTVVAVNCSGRPVASALHDAALEHDADLIVVGCSERGVLGRILARHDVTATLRSAPCAVAVAPDGFAAQRRAIARVGVGYDGGPHAQVAMDAAMAIAARVGARVHALGVAAPPNGIVSPIGISAVAALEAERERTERAIARLAPGIVARAVDGIPHQRLAEFSAKVDLLVVGSSRRGAIGRVLLGSTAEALSHEASCPLLVVPAPVSSRRARERRDRPASAPVA
jgi:nucleotide-binding universal stress UspA family protein